MTVVVADDLVSYLGNRAFGSFLVTAQPEVVGFQEKYTTADDSAGAV